jgi:diguanylate cyclase (GGDEF)-like protein
MPEVRIMRVDTAMEMETGTAGFAGVGRGPRPAGLDAARRERERLRLLCGLNRDLAAAAEVGAMMERISSWLAPLADHDLLLYQDEASGRKASFCSCHGPVREAVEGAVDGDGGVFRRDFALDASSTLSLFRCGRAIEVRDQELLREAVAAAGPALRRAMAHEELFEMATSDALTGLANRRVFDGHAAAMTARAERHGAALTLMALDLDHFKEINDHLGHAEGDRALIAVARELARQVRRSDILARMGGDEFAVILPDTTAADAAVLGERLCRAVKGLGIGDGRGHTLGVSVGIAQWRPGMSTEDWYRLADENLYRAKAAGRGRVAAAAHVGN